MFRVYCKDIECYPKRVHPTDAGLDLKAMFPYMVEANEVTKVHTGIHIEIPDGFVALVYPRSGLAIKHGLVLANGTGVIDSDYRGEIICGMTLQNRGKGDSYYIKRHERIAQLVIMPIWLGILENVDELYKLSDTDRGQGGFGSSGKH